ncbi:MAG TPA: hypothetical protein VFW62_11420 [bacterium]|nr:hypothetical protein [bacterium]
MNRISKLLMLSIFLLTVAACGGSDNDDACEGVTCLEGTSCVVQDSGPACVPN